MQLSARNTLKGTVTDITRGQVMAKIRVDLGGLFVTSLITVDAVDDLALKPSDQVSAIVKSSEVMIGK